MSYGFENEPTTQVALWAANDGDHYDTLVRAAEAGGRALELTGSAIIRQARPNSAAWYVAQELAPNDYRRINWAEVRDQLVGE